MTYAYWNVGKRIIEQEQKGKSKTKYSLYFVKWLSQEISILTKCILGNNSALLEIRKEINIWMLENT